MEFPAELRLAIEERAAGMAPGRLAAAARGHGNAVRQLLAPSMWPCCL